MNAASVDSAPVPVNLTKPLWVDRAWQRLQFALLPPHCLLCAQRSDSTRDLCGACARDLPRNATCCARCAVPLNAPAALCGDCLQHPPPFAAAHAPFVYASPLDQLMTRFKFARSLAAGRVLSQLWIDAWRATPPPLPELLMPIPLHTARLRERGYNQTLELARPLARALGVALRADQLLRTRATAAQTNLDAVERRRNLRGAFAIAERAALPAHVALVDDVMTTGTTLREAAAVLTRAGVARVDVWALARAPKPRWASA